MSAEQLNRRAKVLAFIGGVAFFFAIAMLVAFAEGGQCDVANAATATCQGFENAADLVVGSVCLAIGVVTMGNAVLIRKRLGGPLVGPWRGFL